MENKVFAKNDSGFICGNCGREVPPLGYSSRNHCPFCLYSKHLDIMPGDRQSDCHGLLKPVGIEKFKDTFKILYRCNKCGFEHKNIVANDDNMDLIINLSVQK